MNMQYDPQKAERVNWFVKEHAEANDGYDVDPKTAIVDFVTDLRHLAAQDGVDFDDVIRLATIHYDFEASDYAWLEELSKRNG